MDYIRSITIHKSKLVRVRSVRLIPPDSLVSIVVWHADRVM